MELWPREIARSNLKVSDRPHTMKTQGKMTNSETLVLAHQEELCGKQQHQCD